MPSVRRALPAQSTPRSGLTWCFAPFVMLSVRRGLQLCKWLNLVVAQDISTEVIIFILNLHDGRIVAGIKYWNELKLHKKYLKKRVEKSGKREYYKYI